MSGTNTLTKQVNTRQINWAAEVRKDWGDEWHKREVVYVFSNGRKFVDSRQGPYSS